MNWEDKDIDDLFANAGSGNVPPFDESFWSEMEGMLHDDGKGVDGVFVNAALNQSVPVYKDAYWKEMLAMLPGRKRRTAFYWWYGAAGMLLLISGLGIYFSQYKSGNRHSEESLAKSAGKTEIRLEKKNEFQHSEGKIYSDEAQFDLVKRRLNSDNPAYSGNPANQMPESPIFTNQQMGSGFGYELSNEKQLPEELAELSKLHTGVSYHMARASFVGIAIAEKDPRFYLQAGAGVGQSFMRNAAGTELVHFYSLGGGIQKQLGNTYLSFGVNGRVDFVGNVHNSEFGSSQSDIRQLYAIETPVFLAFVKGKNKFGGILSPGFQMGYTGMYTTYDQDQNVVSRVRTSGRMPQSRTLAMEAGFIYSRTFSDSWSGGCVLAADILRPVGEATYSGQNRILPVNGSIFIRRNL